MKITTKHNIGDKVFITRAKGFNTYFYEVEIVTVKEINIGGKSWEKYDFGVTTRGGTEIFTNLEDAKKDAEKKAKKHYEKNLEIIEKQKLNL